MDFWEFFENYSYLTPTVIPFLYTILYKWWGFGLKKPNKKIEDVDLLIIKIRDKYFKLYSDFLKDYYNDTSPKIIHALSEFREGILGNEIDTRLDSIVDRNFKTINHYIFLKHYIKSIERCNIAIGYIFLLCALSFLFRFNNYILFYNLMLIVLQIIFTFILSRIYKEIDSIEREYKL